MKNDILDKKLVINEEKCIHCGLCEKTCRLRMKLSRCVKGIKKPLF